MANEILKDGEHLLSGVGYFHDSDEYYGDIDGVILVLDGIYYSMCVDANDGYRSYGRLNYALKEYIEKSHITMFPPQNIVVVNVDINERHGDYSDDVRSYVNIYNKETGDVICKIGTDYTDYLYPMAIFYWNPVHLPINMKITYGDN